MKKGKGSGGSPLRARTRAREGRIDRNAEHVLSVDPGETSGLAWCGLDQAFGVEYSPLKGPGVRDERYVNLFGWAQIEGPVDEQLVKIFKGVIRLNVRVLVWEMSDHFLLNPESRGRVNKSSLVPIKLDGALQGLVHLVNESRGDDPFWEEHSSGPASDRLMAGVRQQPGMRNVISADVMRAFGMLGAEDNDVVLRPSGGGRDAYSAVQHLLVFLRRMYGTKGFADTVARQIGIR